jgi:outer membrane lipoprotein-sorting protein
MRSRLVILISLVVLAAVALVVGVAVAGAGQTDPLPTITAPELLSKMAQAKDVTAVSGEVAWHNGLFGDLSQVSGMAHLPAQSPLTSSGSGRIWVSDAGLRVESQGSGGDQVVVVDKAARTAWVYDYAQNSVKKVVVTGSAPAETPSPAPSATMLTPEMISLYLQRLSSQATVEVAGQTKVAGRDTYQLRFTPTATDTALGYVQAAVDGQTMLPLQLEVYAKGGTTPVIKLGFTSVSYDPIDASNFTFTPPEGAKVTAKTIDGDQMRAQMQKAQQQHTGMAEPTKAQKEQAQKLVQGALLTRGEVAKLVPYELAFARDYTARPYQWGYVLGPAGPLTGSGVPLLKVLDGVAGMDLSAATGMDLGGLTIGSHSERSGAATTGPSSVLLYGQGLGTIALAQTETTPDLQKQLQQAQQASQILGSTTVNGAKAIEVGTPLGGVIVWQQGGTTLVAGGMVPMSDLEAFAGSVR